MQEQVKLMNGTNSEMAAARVRCLRWVSLLRMGEIALCLASIDSTEARATVSYQRWDAKATHMTSHYRQMPRSRDGLSECPKYNLARQDWAADDYSQTVMSLLKFCGLARSASQTPAVCTFASRETKLSLLNKSSRLRLRPEASVKGACHGCWVWPRAKETGELERGRRMQTVSGSVGVKCRAIHHKPFSKSEGAATMPARRLGS